MNPVTKIFGSPPTSAADFPYDLKYLLSQYLLSMKQPLFKRLSNTKFYLQLVLQSFLLSADPGEWVQEGRFLGWAFMWKDCSVLSVLLCVSPEKLLEVLIKCSVLGKVSSPHMKYMEGRRFYLSVCGLGRSCCQNKMTHFRSDVLLTEERAASQLICMFVWVPEWIMHTPSFYFSSHGQQICS